jgi:hypothetical protein
MEEAQEGLRVLMALYNHINGGVFEPSPALPRDAGFGMRR